MRPYLSPSLTAAYPLQNSDASLNCGLIFTAPWRSTYPHRPLILRGRIVLSNSSSCSLLSRGEQHIVDSTRKAVRGKSRHRTARLMNVTPSDVLFAFWSTPIRICRYRLPVLLNLLLNLGVWHCNDFFHCGLESVPRFRSFDVLWFRSHISSMMARFVNCENGCGIADRRAIATIISA